MKVYVAGPMTNGGTPSPEEIAANVRAGMAAAAALLAAGHAVYLPHLCVALDAAHPQPYERWLANDRAWIEASDAVVRLPGGSTGADADVQHAIEHRKMVCAGVSAFLEWAAEQAGATARTAN
jgi:hypothetical protein